MVEIVISVAALLIIVGLGRLGMHFGAFYEVVSTLMLALAMMFTLRYWWLLTRCVTGWFGGAGAGYAAFGAYWTLFLVGCVPLIAVMNHVTEESMPKYPKWLDAALGLVFGLLSATIVVCCVMTSLSVVAPKLYEPYNRGALVVPLDTVPISVYRAIEGEVLHISTNAPGHTRFPTFEKSDVDDLSKYWQ